MSDAPNNTSNGYQHSDEISVELESSLGDGVHPHPPGASNGAHVSVTNGMDITDEERRHMNRRQSLQHRNTWPTNVDQSSTRGLMKCKL